MSNVQIKLDNLTQEQKNEMLEKLICCLLQFPFNDNLQDIYEWHFDTVQTSGLQSYNNLMKMVKDAKTAAKFKHNLTKIWPDICNKEELILKCGDKEYSANWLLSLGFLLSEEDISDV